MEEYGVFIAIGCFLLVILIIHLDSFILGKQIDKANKRIREEKQRRLWRVANEQRKECKR